jgi:hypothetical protein
MLDRGDCTSVLATNGGRSLHFLAEAELHAPVCGAQAAAQIDRDDADDFVDFIIRHLGLAEAVDEGGALNPSANARLCAFFCRKRERPVLPFDCEGTTTGSSPARIGSRPTRFARKIYESVAEFNEKTLAFSGGIPGRDGAIPDGREAADRESSVASTVT